MPVFDIHRIRVLPRRTESGQQSLFFDFTRDRGEMLAEIIKDTNYSSVYTTQPWRIADIEEVSDSGIYFRIGRLRHSEFETLRDGHPKMIGVDEWVSTHVLVQIPQEICAIARKSELSRTTEVVASRLIELLMMTKATDNLDATLEISQIADPTSFINDLESASSIKGYTLSFSRPNYFDSDELIYRPSEMALEASGGDTGKMMFLGRQLDQDWCKEVTRTVARQGEQAEARLILPGNSTVVRRSLRRGPATVATEEISGSEEKLHALGQIIDKFNNIGSPTELPLTESSRRRRRRRNNAT